MNEMNEAARTLLALAQAFPAVRDTVREFWGERVADLGPVPPDLRQHFADVDAEIDAALAAGSSDPPWKPKP